MNECVIADVASITDASLIRQSCAICSRSHFGLLHPVSSKKKKKKKKKKSIH